MTEAVAEPSAPRTGARPALTRRGGALVAGGAMLIFVSATAGAPWLTAAGGALLALASLALGTQGARAAMLGDIGLRWAGPPPPAAPRGRPIGLDLEIESPGAEAWVGLRVEPILSGPAEATLAAQLIDVPPRAAATLRFEAALPRAGLWRLWGVRLVHLDALGLSRIEQYHPLPRALHVAPAPPAPGVGAALLSRIGAVRDREGRHLDRQAGNGLELRELRDYIPGDPLKSIAWKASARRGRWLVRAYEDESMRRLQVLMAIGPEMRRGAAGSAPLDAAIDLVATLLAAAGGERIGLTTFDRRVHAHMRPDAGRPHLLRLSQQLLDTTRIVDEDLTEIGDAELCARIGELLERHTGAPLRRLPETYAGRRGQDISLLDPLRELYDEAGLFALVSQALLEERDRGRALLHGKSRPADDLLGARLRVFCALNAIPLPYRQSGPVDALEQGLAQAVLRSLSPGGAETLVVVADLASLAPDGPGLRALRLCRAHKRRAVAVHLGVPLSPTLANAFAAAGVALHDPVPRRGPAWRARSSERPGVSLRNGPGEAFGGQPEPAAASPGETP